MDFVAIFADLEPAQQDEVLERLGEEAVALFDSYVEAGVRATGFRDMSGKEKLEAFRTRAPEMWARIQAMFPRDYKKAMADWGKLEGRDIKREGSVVPPRNPSDQPVSYR